jgi:hypothetical protein
MGFAVQILIGCQAHVTGVYEGVMAFVLHPIAGIFIHPHLIDRAAGVVQGGQNAVPAVKGVGFAHGLLNQCLYNGK